MRNDSHPEQLHPMKVVALAGGVGGARLAYGLAQLLPAADLTVVVNIGDDFEHFGLYICPDLDTICYTLAGMENPETGWGRVDESWNVLQHLAQFGAPEWFRLGDRDLARHLERTRRLQAGEPLSQVTRHICQSLGVQPTVLPASDDAVPTRVETDEGSLSFQEYFVKRGCQPRVVAFRFEGEQYASPAPGVLPTLQQASLVVICPSNPWVSIDPILAIPGIQPGLVQKSVVAVSPIIAGKTVKGPAAKMCRELGIPPTALAVAQHYALLLNGFVLDQADAALKPEILDMGLQPLVIPTLMKTPADRVSLARQVLAFGSRLANSTKE